MRRVICLSLLGVYLGCGNEPKPVETPAEATHDEIQSQKILPRTQLQPALENIAADATSITHGFSTSGTSGGPGFETFTCQFLVPPVPSYGQQSLFLWCGVQQSSGVTPTGDTSFGVLQPVLMFGPDCVQELAQGQGFGPGNDPNYESDPYWYVSAQYVYPSPIGSTDYRCTSGPVFKVNPGDTLISSFTYETANQTMTVAVSCPESGNSSSLTVANPWDESSQSWSQFIGGDAFILEAAIEIWNLTAPDQWPSGTWQVTTNITQLSSNPFSNDDQWQLVPWNNGPPQVTCGEYNPATFSSNCTWTFPP